MKRGGSGHRGCPIDGAVWCCCGAGACRSEVACRRSCPVPCASIAVDSPSIGCHEQCDFLLGQRVAKRICAMRGCAANGRPARPEVQERAVISTWALSSAHLPVCATCNIPFVIVQPMRRPGFAFARCKSFHRGGPSRMAEQVLLHRVRHLPHLALSGGGVIRREQVAGRHPPQWQAGETRAVEYSSHRMAEIRVCPSSG